MCCVAFYGFYFTATQDKPVAVHTHDFSSYIDTGWVVSQGLLVIDVNREGFGFKCMFFLIKNKSSEDLTIFLWR